MFDLSRRSKRIVIAVAVVLPAVVSLVGATLAAKGVFNAFNAGAERTGMEEARAQTRLLIESVWDKIDDLKIRAIAHEHEAARSAPLEFPLRAYSKVKLDKNGSPAGISEFIAKPGIDRSEVEAGVKLISLRDAQNVGASLVPLPSGNLGFAFLDGKARSTLLFVIVNPGEAFPSFSRWASNRIAGGTRAYMVGAGGRILVHSERGRAGIDASNTQVYRDALAPLFRGERISGAAVYPASDSREALTSYTRIAMFPVAVVVERMMRSKTPIGIALIFRSTLMLALFVALLCGLSIFALMKIVIPRESVEAVMPAPELDEMLMRVSEAEDLRSMKARLQEVLARARREPSTEDAPESPASSPEVLTNEVSRSGPEAGV